MPAPRKYPTQTIEIKNAVPFDTTEEAWFWFIAAQQAKTDGARFIAGQALVQRPCEPLDILKTLDRLYRNRRVMRDHLLVLRHYGRRYMAPDPHRIKEARAHALWTQALDRLGEALKQKGIVRRENTINDFIKDSEIAQSHTLQMRPPAAPQPTEQYSYAYTKNTVQNHMEGQTR